jgi:hypothetical protein
MSQMVAVVVNNVTFAEIDPDALTVRAQLDLERARGALDLLRWCQRHGGMSAEQIATLEEELANMPLRSVIDLTKEIGRALNQAVALPKVNGKP